MQLFKTLIIVVSLVFVVISGWLYFNRDLGCENQPWWIVFVLGVLNIALIIALFLRRQNLEEDGQSSKL